MNLKCDLACIECGKHYDIFQVRYLCDCGGLLEVSHNQEALKEKSGAEWKALFQERFRGGPAPYSSGVWGKKEWVLPHMEDSHIVSLGEGATPLLRLQRYAQTLGAGEIYIKQCGVSHTGSFKDLGMTVLVSHVMDLKVRGIPIRAVACASTGDTSAALAAYAAAAGIPTIVFLPAGKISSAQLAQPVSSGSLVLSLDTDFDGCMKVVKEVTEDRSLYLANSMNPLRIEGQKTISIEIVQQLGWQAPDWIVIPGGNLGNVSALASGLDMLANAGLLDRAPRICLAQSRNANPMYLSYKSGYRFEPVQARTTLASAIQIGNPVSFPRAVRALKQYGGVVEEASEQELADAAAEGDLFGLFNDPHTGVALAAAKKLIARGEIRSTDRVVVISTAHGLKFQEFKSGYHEGRLSDVNGAFRNSVVKLPPAADAVRDAINQRLGAR